MGVAHAKCQKMLDVSQSTRCSTCRECVPHVEPSRGGCTRSITLAQRRACVRTIIIGGLDIVVDMRNALSEHLIVVVSTNIVRHTLHEAGLRSLEKCRKSFAHCQECALQVGLCSTSSRLDYA
jgi:hypothetical protein